MGEKSAEKIDGKIIKKTQDNLGKIIKNKPPLTDKLLNKPPFRFLHDIITSVIKNSGFMKGLHPDADLVSDNVKEKDAKIAFLQKCIDLVALVNGKTVSAKPSKIVSGHEPERTNEFLQALADAVNKKVDNDDYVQRVLKGDSKPSSSKKERGDREASSDKKKRDKDKDKDEDRDRRHKERKEDREKSRDREKDKEKDKDKDKDRDRKDREKSRDRRHRDRSRDGGEEGEKRERHHRDKDERRSKRREAEEDEADKENEAVASNQDEDLPARIPRPTSAKGSRRRHGHGRQRPDSSEEDDEDLRRQQEKPAMANGSVGEDDLPPQVANARRMARPSSARPAPPRPKKDEGVSEPVIMGSSNVPNLIVDKKGDDSDDDDAFIAKDDEIAADPMMGASKRDDDDDADHGGLVKKMLETKKGLEGGSQQPGSHRKTEIERSQNDATRRKEREMVQKEIDKLRGSIQVLTRSVNPLGKILDFLQEDMDSMQKELDVWKRENKENAIALHREQSITDSSVEPLKAQLQELDAAIHDQLDLIAAVKSNALKNDDKIDKMLSTVTKS